MITELVVRVHRLTAHHVGLALCVALQNVPEEAPLVWCGREVQVRQSTSLPVTKGEKKRKNGSDSMDTVSRKPASRSTSELVM